MKVVTFDNPLEYAKWVNDNPLSIDVKHVVVHNGILVVTYMINAYKAN